MKYSTSFNIALLKYAAEHKILKPIALYYQVRSKYRHPIIYNCTVNKLKTLTGKHPKTIQRYLKKLLDHELVEWRGKHLVFKKSPFKSYTRTLNTVPYTSFEGILNRIQFLLLENNRSQQQYKIAERYGKYKFLKVLNPRTRHKAIKNCSKHKPESFGLESNIQPIVTATSAQRLFNTSRTTANNILNRLKRRNYINLKKKIHCLGRDNWVRKLNGMTVGGMNETFNGYFFRSPSGFLFKYLGREFTLGSYIAIERVYYAE